MQKSLLFDKIKKIWNFNLSYLLPGYKFNNLIFRIGIGLIFIWLLVAGVRYGWDWTDKPYFKCESKSPGMPLCENPWYAPGTPDLFGFVVPCVNPVPGREPDLALCSKEFFSPGEEYGSPPDFWMVYAHEFALFICGCMVLLNHVLYNRGYGKKFKKLLNDSQKED